jgi:hypothetical protein
VERLRPFMLGQVQRVQSYDRPLIVLSIGPPKIAA